MRKLFRFKYEPCNGTCYAWCDKLIKELRKLESDERMGLVQTMVDAHDRLCDNPAYSFGVDMDEKNGLFIAHFKTPQFVNLYSSIEFKDAILQVCEAVMKEEIPQISGECNFGQNGAEDLGREILKYCTDEMQKELSEKHCECKAHSVAI